MSSIKNKSGDLSLGKLTLLYTIGNLTSRGLTFALFFFYTFFLSKEDIGYYDIIISTVSLLTPLLSLQIYDAILRWLISAKDSYQSKSVISNGFFVVVLSCFASLLLIGIVYPFVEIRYLPYIAILIISTVIYTFFQFVARGLGFNKIYIESSIWFSVFFLILSAASIYILGLAVDGILISNIIAILVAIIILLLKTEIPKYISIKSINMEQLKEMVIFSVPLIPNSLSWWAISMANRYIIILYLGIASNGIFATAMKLPSMLFMITSIFYMAWVEKAIKTSESNQKDSYYSDIFSKYFIVLFSAIIVLIAVSKPILRLIVSPTYYEVWKYLPLLYIATGYQAISSFFGTLYLVSKNTKGAFVTSVYGAIVTIGLSFLLINKIGLIGACISITLGFLTVVILRAIQSKKLHKIQIPVREIILSHIFLIVISLGTLSENLIVLAINILLSFLIFVFMNKEILISFYDRFGSNMLNRMTKQNSH